MRAFDHGQEILDPDQIPIGIRWRRLSLVLLITSTVVWIAGFVWYRLENARGHAAWDRLRHQEKAAGHPLDWESMAPPPAIIDSNNFADASAWRAVGIENSPVSSFGSRLDVATRTDLGHLPGTWTTGPGRLLFDPFTSRPSTESIRLAKQALASLEPELQQLREACTRPEARLPTNYRGGNNSSVPGIHRIREVTRIVLVHATIALAEEDPAMALVDAQVIFRTAQMLSREPTLPVFSTAASILDAHGLEVVWSGLARHQWSEPQLQTLQQQLSSWNLFQIYADAAYRERAFVTDFCLNRTRSEFARMICGMRSPPILGIPAKSHFLGLLPEGWRLLNLVTYVNGFPEPDRAGMDIPHRRIPSTDINQRLKTYDPEFNHPNLHSLLASLALPHLGPMLTDTLPTQQSRLHMAVIACALERYRLKHHRLPDSLDTLTTTGAWKEVPNDPFSAGPIHYALLQPDSNRFRLYSVGPNRVDDHGLSTTPGRTTDDLVWPDYPNPAHPAPPLDRPKD